MLQNDRERSKNGSRDSRLCVYRARLSPNLLHFSRIGNLPRPFVHVALTARCEPHSRLVARLEDAEGTNVEW